MSHSGVINENTDEVIHATWEKFFTNLEQFEGRSQIRTFICGILFNKIREHRRAVKKMVYEDDADDVLSRVFTIDGWWKVEPQSPQAILESRQTGELIKSCLEDLGEQQRAAFILREVGGETSEMICETLQVKSSHLRVLLFALKKTQTLP